MKKVIGVDLGGTHTRVALLEGGKIIKLLESETPKTRKLIIKLLEDNISLLFDKDIKGIGIGSAGVIKNGVVKNSPNLPLKGFDIKKHFSSKFKIRVEVENDANCVALAELFYGCKKKNFFILTVGTGIGGGIIIDGNLYKGRGNAGELGHIILHDGKDLESYTGAKAVKKLIAKNYGIKNIKEEKLVQILDSGNLKSKKIRGGMANFLGQGIASLISVFDPEIVILTGGMTKIKGDFLKEIKKNVKRYCFLESLPEINFSKLPSPGIIGAGSLLR